jgi:4-hydroxy-3-polyprenylbenzoate decarboxylase
VAKALLAALQQDDWVGHVNLLVSASGRELVAFEFQTGEDSDSVVRALEATSPKVRFLDPADMSGPVTSAAIRATR